MTSHYTDFDPDAVSFVTVDDKSTIVNGQKVVYKTAKFSYEHTSDNGIMVGDMKFEMPEVKIPYGLDLEKGYNLKGRFEFPRDNKDATDCVSSVARTQTKGWVKKSDVSVEMDVGSCTATPLKDETNVYKTPETSGKYTNADTSIVMKVVGKSPDGEFLSVEYGGTDGFFEKLRVTMAQMVFKHRSKFDLGDKSYDDIFGMITDPVYVSKDSKTGALRDRDPAIYFSVIYYPYRPAQGDKPAMKESMARFEVPGMDDVLSLETLKTKCITCIPIVKLLHLTKSGSRLSMKLSVTNACVTDIDDIVTVEQKSTNYTKYSQNEALVNKLRMKMSTIKSQTPVTRTEEPVTTATGTENDDNFNLEDMLNSDAPTLEPLDLDLDN